jgi:hypothetical protein
MVFRKAFFFFLLLMLTACGSDIYPPVENPLDAGRQFIDAIYKGNFKRADQLILDDEQNKTLLKTKLEDDYHNRNSTDRNNLGLSSINISNVKNIGDSICVINFLNNYTNKTVMLKVLKQSGTWLVDLKYTFQ